MALTPKQKALLREAIAAHIEDNEPTKIANQLVNLLLQDRASQKAQLRAWLTNRRGDFAGIKAGLDQATTDEHTRLQDILDTADSILGGSDI